jgi:hypothetical protein
MKKLIVALLSVFTTGTFAQEAFNKHNVIATGGIGGGIGYSYQNYSSNDLNYNNVYDDGIYVGYNVGYTIPVTIEYALSNKFGIGGSFARNSYVNTTTSKSNILNFGAFGAFHFARKEKIEMYVRLNGGFSTGQINIPTDGYYSTTSNKYISNNKYKSSIKGWFVKPSYGFRLYFSKNVGMFTDVGIGVYSLHSNTVDVNDYTVDLSNYNKLRLVMFGVEVSTGIAIKF